MDKLTKLRDRTERGHSKLLTFVRTDMSSTLRTYTVIILWRTRPSQLDTVYKPDLSAVDTRRHPFENGPSFACRSTGWLHHDLDPQNKTRRHLSASIMCRRHSMCILKLIFIQTDFQFICKQDVHLDVEAGSVCNSQIFNKRGSRRTANAINCYVAPI